MIRVWKHIKLCSSIAQVRDDDYGPDEMSPVSRLLMDKSIEEQKKALCRDLGVEFDKLKLAEMQGDLALLVLDEGQSLYCAVIPPYGGHWWKRVASVGDKPVRDHLKEIVEHLSKEEV